MNLLALKQATYLRDSLYLNLWAETLKGVVAVAPRASVPLGVSSLNHGDHCVMNRL